MINPVKHLPREISLGVQNETGVTEIGFDVTPWLEAWPGMQVSVWHTLPGQTEAYQAECRMDGHVLYWVVTATDTQTPGTGKVELMGTTPDGTRKRLTGDGMVTRIGATTTATTQAPPGAPPSWIDTVKQMIAKAPGTDYGAAAAGMLLYVGSDGRPIPLALGDGLQIVDGVLHVLGGGSAVVTLTVDAEGHATLSGATLTVDAEGHAEITGGDIASDSSGDATIE